MRFPIRIVLVLIISTFLQACGVSSNDSNRSYSTNAQRVAWEKSLQATSVQPVKTTFHALGHLLVTTGKFLIPDASALRVLEWINLRKDMLGIPSHSELVERAAEPQRNDIEAKGPAPTRVLIYEVVAEGFPFVGLPIRVVLDPNENAIRSVINGFSPPTRGFADPKPSPEERAWSVAETHIGGKLERVTSVQTWFDKDWALNRLPGVKELHWRLEGIDAQRSLRYVFVRTTDDSVSYATPAQTFFDVHQTHKNDANNVLWDSQTLPQGCTSGSAGCSGNALAQSLISRVVFPGVVDVWYRLFFRPRR